MAVYKILMGIGRANSNNVFPIAEISESSVFCVRLRGLSNNLLVEIWNALPEGVVEVETCNF